MSERGRGEQGPTNERDRRISPKVWIASLSDYNAGYLHGAWVEADQEPDDLWEGVNEVLRTSKTPGAEEWAVFDFEGFGPLKLSEYETVERISRLGRGIAEHGEAFAAFATIVGQGGDELLGRFEDSYIGYWESLTAYADDYMQAAGVYDLLDQHLPEALRSYIRIDTEALGVDMELAGSVVAVDDSTESGVHLFFPP